MTNYSVQLQFDAASSDEARTVLDSWVLSDGVTVVSVVATDFAPGTPLVVGGDVKVGSALDAPPPPPEPEADPLGVG